MQVNLFINLYQTIQHGEAYTLEWGLSRLLLLLYCIGHVYGPADMCVSVYESAIAQAANRVAPYA